MVRISAIDAALELEKAGANVTVLYRGGDYSPSIKPWILPNFTALVNHEKIDMEFNANVTQYLKILVTYEVNGESKTIHNDYVFAMIGYHPDYEFLKSVGIQINTNEFGTAPMYNKEHTKQISKIVHCRCDCCREPCEYHFIENGKFHGGIIAQSMLAKKQTPLES